MNLEFWISLILSLMVFSYLLGDNVLYRIAVSLFVGLAAAYTSIITFQSVILPLFDGSLGNWVLLISSGTLAFLLLLKPLRPLRPITNFALAFLIAVGAAAAVVGAVSGTIIPLITRTTALPTNADAFDWISSVIVIIGVITSLLYFRYGAKGKDEQGAPKRGRINMALALVGESFIVITLGAVYGAAILSSLSILIGQLINLFA